MIAMLRGVNVGGHHKVKMDVLRALGTSLKFDCAQTYLQSGNVVFRSSMGNVHQIRNLLETAMEKKLGFRPVGMRPNYYADDKEDAVVMVYDF